MDAKRAEILLRAAYDILTRCERAYYVQEVGGVMAHYDGADCDGMCLREEIAECLGMDADTDPIPTDEKEGE